MFANINKIQSDDVEVYKNLNLFNKINIDETCNIKCENDLKINNKIIATRNYVDEKTFIIYETIPLFYASLDLNHLKADKNYIISIFCLNDDTNKIIGTAVGILTLVEKNNILITKDEAFITFLKREGIYIEANLVHYERDKIIIFNAKKSVIEPNWIFIVN